MSPSSSINEIEPSPSQEKGAQYSSNTSNEALPEGPRPHKSVQALPLEAPPFTIASLWQAPVVNPINLKCYTLRASFACLPVLK